MLKGLFRRWLMVLALGVLIQGPSWAAEPLEIGITPYYSTRLLFKQYEPLRVHLEKTLGRPTYFVTATDFQTFALKTRDRAYRFIFDVPHFGRLAEVDDGYRVLLQMKAVLRGTFLVAQESPGASLADLRGLTVSTPDPLAIITMMGAEALVDAGLMPGETVTLIAKPSHNAAVLSVLNGESDAALVWYKTLASMAPETIDRLRVIGNTVDEPIFILFLAAPQVEDAEVQAVRQALLDFAASDEGRAFAQATGYGHIAPVSSDDLTSLDRYLGSVRRALDVP
ncbi:phosphate/phosphite/phosphonate ABC transporter substrate-binding protein [Magnetospira thiophila]